MVVGDALECNLAIPVKILASPPLHLVVCPQSSQTCGKGGIASSARTRTSPESQELKDDSPETSGPRCRRTGRLPSKRWSIPASSLLSSYLNLTIVLLYRKPTVIVTAMTRLRRRLGREKRHRGGTDVLPGSLLPYLNAAWLRIALTTCSS